MSMPADERLSKSQFKKSRDANTLNFRRLVIPPEKCVIGGGRGHAKRGNKMAYLRTPYPPTTRDPKPTVTVITVVIENYGDRGEEVSTGEAI